MLAIVATKTDCTDLEPSMRPFTRPSFHHQPEAQHPKSSAIHKIAGRLSHRGVKSGHCGTPASRRSVITVRNSSRSIARVFRATAAPGCRDELLQRFHSSSAALVNSKVGCLKYRILEPVDASAPEVVFESIWWDLDAVKVAFGDAWQQSHICQRVTPHL